jgi:hypothetical protein
VQSGKLHDALTRDDLVKDCQGRKIAIVVDCSSPNKETDPFNLRILATQLFNEMLVSKGEAAHDGIYDSVTVIDFDEAAKVIYALGDPAGANFRINSYGGTYVAGGLSLAVDGRTKDPQEPPDRRAGVVVLINGEDSRADDLMAQVARTLLLGIRVHLSS